MCSFGKDFLTVKLQSLWDSIGLIFVSSPSVLSIIILTKENWKLPVNRHWIFVRQVTPPQIKNVEGKFLRIILRGTEIRNFPKNLDPHFF